MYSVNSKDSSVFYAGSPCCSISSLSGKDECLDPCDHFERGHDYYYKEGSGKTTLTTMLAKHYGFTEEELDFIINYDIKYRMGDELNAGE